MSSALLNTSIDWSGLIEKNTGRIDVVTEQDISRMIQREGAGKQLFAIDDLLREPKIVPWDIWGMMLHSRKNQVLKREMAP